jgi:hypothetical protein
MNLDIHSGVTTFLILMAIATIAVFLSGLRTLQSVKKIQFFRIRRDTSGQGWLVVFISFLMLIFTILLGIYAEPIVYTYLPPTATIPPTFTITITPTLSLTSTITLTPTITNTPSETSTPWIPPTIEAGFLAQLAPNPDAVFSPLRFSRRIDNTNQPVSPLTEFRNPVGHIYGSFSFDKMIDGSQWTALWYRSGELVYFESTVWEGGSGGYGYTDWNPSAEAWLPGEYEVQLFAGNQWKRSGAFTVIGFPVTSTYTISPSATATPSRPPLVTKSATLIP